MKQQHSLSEAVVSALSIVLLSTIFVTAVLGLVAGALELTHMGGRYIETAQASAQLGVGF